MMKKITTVGLLIGAMISAPLASASLLYTFDYNELTHNSTTYAATSISFTSSTFATEGDTLYYESGSLNGCTPSEIGVTGGGAFATLPFFDTSLCGDELGPFVDGMFFLTDVGLPSALGTYVSSSRAGREFRSSASSISYRYVGGSLTISEFSVPSPAGLLIFGVGLLGLAGRRLTSRIRPHT